jgi:crotonobetainyl-CoA:carnitine CoA-transferase CaiB-like acyl-CoA transferase
VALNEAIGRHTRRYTAAALIELLAAAGVPCGPIYKMDQVFADPQVRTSAWRCRCRSQRRQPAAVGQPSLSAPMKIILRTR